MTDEFNEPTGKEFKEMIANGKKLHKSADDGKRAVGTEKAEYTKTITDFNEQIDKFYSDLSDFQKTTTDNTDTQTGISKAIVWVFLIGTVVSLGLIVLLYFCSVKGKCVNLSDCFRALISILMMLLAILINIIAFFFLLISMIVMHACYATEKTMNDPKFVGNLAKGLTKLMNSCVYETATGKVSGFIGDTKKFDDLTEMTATFSQGFTKYNPRADPSVDKDSVALEKYELEILNKWKDYTRPAFGTSSPENHMTVISPLNSGVFGTCTTDKLSPTNALCSTIAPGMTASVAGTAENAASPLCMDMSTFAFTFTGRYTTANYGSCNNLVIDGPKA